MVDKNRQRAGAVGRAAASHHPDDIEDLEGFDGAQHQRDHQRPGKIGQDDEAEACEGTGAVDQRGGGDVARHRLQGSQRNQRHQRKVLPAIGDDQRRQRRCGLAQPGPVAVDQMQLRQCCVQRAVFGIVDQPPERGVDDGRQRPGQDHQPAQHGAAAEFLVEQKCREHADHHFGGDRNDGEPCGGDSILE